MEEPASSPSPYRPDKPLAEIIPPDRRREKMIALVVASMVASVALWTLGGWGLEALRTRSPANVGPPPTAFVSGRITPTTLGGPGGPTHVPLAQLHVVHVWLQGCQDCMPAFEAMKELEGRGGLGLHVPVLNVAYGEADPTWAHRYGVGSDLLFDTNGIAFVKPLGIGSFTTLVIDAHGTVIHRDRPDRPGYRDRVRAAVGESDPELAADPRGDPSRSEPTEFNATTIERVVASHRAAIKRTCWERAPLDKVRSASVVVRARISPDGRVEDTSLERGTDAATPEERVIAECVGRQVRGWRFPAPAATTTVTIPFHFVRQ